MRLTRNLIEIKMVSLVKNRNSHSKKIETLVVGLLVALLTGCGGDSSESPSTFGSRAGEDGAKYFKENNPGQIASEESAGTYCADMAQEGSRINNWTAEEILQAADSCSIWFTTEMFRQ